MNCEDIRMELIAYLKGELATAQAASLEEHLAKCPSCRAELDEARRVITWTEAASSEATVTKVTELIDKAIGSGASDIHLDPQRDGSAAIRLRVDGVLYEAGHIAPVSVSGVISRVKLLAEMEVGKASMPQDGRFTWASDGKDYGIRMNSMPQIYGESIEIRILARSVQIPGLDGIGLSPEDLSDLRKIIRQPTGIVLVAGPTGAGKTTTGYAMLKEIASPSRKTVTIEDPVEVTFPWVEHTQVRKADGFTYARAIQAYMRHDPDILYVGQMNDSDTADAAVRAAAGGHQVISTIVSTSALDALEAVGRMSMNRSLAALILTGIVAQRLVRTICPDCAAPYVPEENDRVVKILGISEDEIASGSIRKGAGCEKCRHTGYYGRTAVFEVLPIDRELAGAFADGRSAEELSALAKSKGFRPIVCDAKRKVLQGATTAEEAVRVLW